MIQPTGKIQMCSDQKESSLMMANFKVMNVLLPLEWEKRICLGESVDSNRATTVFDSFYPEFGIFVSQKLWPIHISA